MSTGRSLFLGIDPGTAHIGIAVIEVGLDGYYRFVDGKTMHPFDIRPSMFSFEKVRGVVAAGVELPEARSGAGGIRYVTPTAAIGGLLAGMCQCTGIEPVFLFPRHWRRLIVGKGAAKDAEIKAALMQYIDLPPTNSHVRDAVGVAMVAAQKILFGENVGNALEVVHGEG